MNIEPVLYWIEERERIRRAKEDGLSKMLWTNDQILSKYRFCNVRREDDRVTIWIRKNIRGLFADHSNLWLMLCIARQINWPSTLEYLINGDYSWPHNDDFEPEELGHCLAALKEDGFKVFTGAYIIPGGSDGNKAGHIASIIAALWQRRDEFSLWFKGRPTLEGTWNMLKQAHGWGAFLAYQAVVDMRFTKLLDRAEDINSWAAAGPGTIRGLNRIHGRPLNKQIPQAQALAEMIELAAAIRGNCAVTFDFSDIPNILCEVDKYLRAKLNEGRPRAYYTPT